MIHVKRPVIQIAPYLILVATGIMWPLAVAAKRTPLSSLIGTLDTLATPKYNCNDYVIVPRGVDKSGLLDVLNRYTVTTGDEFCVYRFLYEQQQPGSPKFRTGDLVVMRGDHTSGGRPSAVWDRPSITGVSPEDRTKTVRMLFHTHPTRHSDIPSAQDMRFIRKINPRQCSSILAAPGDPPADTQWRRFRIIAMDDNRRAIAMLLGLAQNGGLDVGSRAVATLPSLRRANQIIAKYRPW